MNKLVEHLTAAMSSYLAGDPAHRLKLMGDHVEVFEIEDPDHPAKRCNANLQWLGLRPQERGLRAKKVSHPLSRLLHHCFRERST